MELSMFEPKLTLHRKHVLKQIARKVITGGKRIRLEQHERTRDQMLQADTLTNHDAQFLGGEATDRLLA